MYADTNLRIDPNLLLANDYDPDFNNQTGAGKLTITAVSNGEHGQVLLDALGNILFAPDENFNGIASFNYTVTDETGLSTVGRAEVDIKPVNDAPATYGETINSREDEILTIDAGLLLANDEDPDTGAILHVVAVDQAINGEVLLKDGKVLFTPKLNYFGEASFRYIVSDGEGGLSEAIAKINIAAMNDAPNRVDRGFAATEDTVFKVSIAQLMSGVADIDGDAVTFVKVKDAQGGTLTQSGTDIIFTPMHNAIGAAYFAYEVADAKGAVTTSFVTLNVNNTNDQPELLPGVSLNFQGQEDTPIHISESAILGLYADPDTVSGDVLSIASVTARSAGDTVTYNNVTGEVVYTPAHNISGTTSFDVRVQDKAGAYINTTFTVNVAAINDAPTVGAVGFSVLEDGGATDSSKQALSYLYHSTIFDSATIYDAEGDALSITGIRNGITADGQTVQVNNYTGPNAGDNKISILAPLNYNGAISFEFKVSDGHGGETWQTAYGKVSAVNDLPDITVVYLGAHVKQSVQMGFFGNGVNILDIGLPQEYYRLDISDVEDGSNLRPEIDRYPLQSIVHQGQTWGTAHFVYQKEATNYWQKPTTVKVPFTTTSKASDNYFSIENWIVHGTTREESITFKVTDNQGGTSYKSVTFWAHGYDPVVIDLGSDGLEFIDAADSNVMVDRNGDGIMQKMAWIKPGEGILAWDHNHDGVINRNDEIEFWSHVNPQLQGVTDLQALARPEFDSNQDGKFDAADSKWSEFKLWQDTNSNGVSDAGELKTLAEAGIKTLYLNANMLNRSYGEDVLLRGYTSVEMTDGRLLQAGDVQLNVLPSDWVPADNPLSAAQQTAGLISAADAQAAFTSQQLQANTQRDGSPDFTGGLSAHKVLTNTTYHYVMPADLFPTVSADAQVAVKQVNGQPLPVWLSFDAATRTLSGTPGEGQLGEWSFKVSATDTNGNTASGIMQLTIAETNQAPILYGNMPTQFVSESEFLELNIAPNFFIDRNTGDQLNYHVTLEDGSPLPDWLHFDANSLRLFGTPGPQDVGAINLLLSASDEANAAAHTSFALIVSAINDAPVLANPVASISMVADVPNTYALPANLFVDPDIGDQIVITATLANGATLPDWLNFDAATLTFTATPTAAQLSAPISLLISATDMSGFVTSTYIPLISAITGTDANDTLIGTAYDDVMYGGLGNDTLNGTAGADKLIGGAGNDTYVVDRFDTLVENVNEGIDSVRSDISWTLGNNFENITLTGTAAINGNGNDLSNGIDGNNAPNILVGGAGNDVLDGRGGADILAGGLGFDTYILDDIGDIVIENQNEGSDTVYSYVSYTLGANLEELRMVGGSATTGIGNQLDNTLSGNSNTSANTLKAGLGNDIYLLGINDIAIENPNEGIDTVYTYTNNYTLGGNIENLYLNVANAASLTGNDLNNSIMGNVGNDTLNGGAGDDMLNGGGGADTMAGGTGNDTYILDNLADTVIENPNEGTDLLNVAIATAGGTYTLAANVENATATSSVAFNLTGNELNNTLIGNAAANILDGGAGNDTLMGSAGDDTYIVDLTATNALQDTITETASGGADTVRLRDGSALITFSTLTLGIEIDNLDASATGTTLLNLIGNYLNNTLTGNAAANTLNGGTGADTLIGGAGNDIYVVDNTGDIAIETSTLATEIDLVQSGVNFTLGDYLENLTLTGITTINGTGNTLNNIITGNAANNILDGGAGDDILIGGLGNDTYTIDALNDVVTENANEGTDLVNVAVATVGGTYTLAANIENATLTSNVDYNLAGNGLNNTLTGNAAANTLTGGAGNDVLNGLSGSDIMLGGLGDDTYTIDVTTDVVTENVSEGTDLVNVAVATAGGTYTLAGNVENTTLTNTVAYNLTGNNLNNILIGNAEANILNSGAGADTLIGGVGNDTYVIDNAADIVNETSAVSTETDLIQSSISYTLGANVENLILTGTSAINGTGNTLNNTLTGNAANNILNGGIGNDTLDGGAGTDTLIGGSGDDIYIADLTAFNTLQDTIIEVASGGVDTLRLRGGGALTGFMTLTLGTEIDNLDASATGTTLLNLAGNALNNTLTGNATNNTLNGGTGADMMVGGAGNDIYFIDNQADMITENTNEGTDLLNIAIATAGGTYTLAVNIENATLTNTVAYNLTGNELNNTLTGNAAANTLSGGAGNDVLNGLSGSDTMIGGLGDDTYSIDTLTDVISENADEGTDSVNVAIATYNGTYTLAANVENATLTSTVVYNLTGNTLNNALTGNSAVNNLNGGNGDDLLDGRLGNDILTGGLGADTFKFSSEIFNTHIDIISDFLSGTDKIALDATVFKKLLNDANLSDNIVVRSYGSSGLDANDYLIYNSYTKALYYDADGSGFSYKPIQFATLTNVPTVSASDFVVI